MPLYEYSCDKGHTYDITQGYDAPPEHQCMEAPGGVRCKGTAKRVIHVPDFFIRSGRVEWERKHLEEIGREDPQKEGYKVVSDSVKDLG